jgi:hypothetical protein
MTVAKRTRQIFGETKRQTNEARKVKNEINNYANLTTSTLSEMTKVQISSTIGIKGTRGKMAHEGLWEKFDKLDQ